MHGHSSFDPGDFILITGGVFERFTATVVSVDEAKSLISAEIDVFGCKTPVEVPLAQAKRVEKLRQFPMAP